MATLGHVRHRAKSARQAKLPVHAGRFDRAARTIVVLYTVSQSVAC
jgi:hypothetical protein